MGGARKGVLQTGAVVDDPTRVTSASRAWCRRPKGNDSTERSLAFIAQNVRGLSATKLECFFELMTQRCAYAAVITETKRCAESDAVEYPREQGTFLVFYHGLAANGKNRRSQGVAVVLSPEAASDWKCAESPPPVVMFGERIIALQLAARGLSRGHSKYKKVLLVGAYAPVSSAPEGERELFLRNLQAAVESAERDALLVVGGDFNAQLGVRQPDSLVGVRDTVRGPFGIPHVNRAGEALLDVLVSCELRAVLSYFEKRTRKDFFADNFDAAYGTWLHPGTKKPYTLDHWFVRQADFKYVTDAAVNSAGVPKTDHRLVRLDLVFKFLPRRLQAAKPRIDRTLLEDPVLKLKFQNSVADFIDAAQKGQYAALTTQFPSMVAHTLPPGHPGTEFAPAGVLDAALECAAKKHLEVVTSRRSPNWFEAHREALNKAIAFRNECSSQLFKRPKDAAVKAEFARARQVLRKAVRRARARFRIDLIRNLNCNPKHCPGQTFEVIRKLQSISSSQDSGTKKSVMRLKNPLTGALCKSRQENAEVYRHFAENLYSRTQATLIDQGIIELLDQRPVNHLLAAEPDEHELWKVLKNRKCGSAPGGDGKFVDFYKALCAPLEGGSGRGLTQLLEVVRYIWRTEKVEESWLVGKLRLLPKSGDLSNPNNWRGITLLAVIAKLFCSVLSNRMTSHMQVIGLEAQCGFMPGKSTIDAIFTMRVSLQKRFRFQKDTWVLFVDFVKAFDTVPREMLFKVLARLGFPPKIVNLVRVFHENVTLEVDLDGDGNTIIIKYDIGVKQGDTLAPVLFLCYIQAVLETLFPKFEAAGIEKLKFRSMQPKPAVVGEMAAGSLMVKPDVFHSSISHAPSLPKSVIVHTGNIAIVPQSAGPTNCPKPPSLFAPRAVQLIGAQVRCKRKSCTKRKPCPECALSDHLDVLAKVPTGALVIYTDGGCDVNRKSRVTRTLRSYSTGAQAHDQKPAGWGFCVFEMAPGDSSAGLGRLKPIVELFGPVVTDESDPLFMGADGHSNNTGELQAVAEALLWLKDTERSLSPVLFCLDSEYAANAIQGTSQVHKNAVLIEKGKQLYLEEARRRAGGFSFTHVPSHCKILGNERADELAARGKANLRCTVGRFENCGPPRSARPETSKDPSCSEIEVIIRDFESGPGVFADDGAFAFGSRRDIELGARILYDHCVRWGMMPHTAGKTVAMYFGQPVVNLREFLPDEAIPPIKMGDGEAPVVEEFKYLGSMLSKNFDDSVTIMARIRLARIAFTKLQKAIFGTRRVALESKKIAYESLVLSLLLYGSECWVVNAENMRLLQRFHRKCIRIMCRVTRHHTRKHHISTEELEAKLGIHDIRHYVHSRVLRYLGHVFRMDADRTPSLLQRCWVVDGKQPSGKIKVLYDSAVQKLLDEVGLSLLDAANKSEWHNITRPEALAAQARAASGVSAQVAAKRPSRAAVTKGAASSTSRAAASGASVTASATCKPESRRNLKPTKPAIEISDADRKRKILITDKCTMAFKKWREKGESFRVDRYRCIEGRCLHQIMSAKTKVTKTKTALKQETYNLSDLKHDLHCGFVELGGSVSVSS